MGKTEMAKNIQVHLCDMEATVFLDAAKSRTLEVLAFDEYCSFDTSAFF